MNCISCQPKDCKTDAKDCVGTKSITIEKYRESSTLNVYENADKLVSNGKAGQLSRVEEVAEFCLLQNHRSIGIAYCYAMEDLAGELQAFLKQKGLRVQSFRCTIEGIRENQVSQDLGKSVNCNPIGQAQAINQANVDFVIEMGLCLGHDVLFHQHLKKPFTVLFVKDRVYNHCPQKFFEVKVQEKAS